MSIFDKDTFRSKDVVLSDCVITLPSDEVILISGQSNFKYEDKKRTDEVDHEYPYKCVVAFPSLKNAVLTVKVKKFNCHADAVQLNARAILKGVKVKAYGTNNSLSVTVEEMAFITVNKGGGQPQSVA